MSEQSRRPNDETSGQSRPGKRLAHQEQHKPGQAKPPLTPEQAQKKREKIIMVVMIVVAVIMVAAAALVLFYNRWVKKPQLPSPGPDQSNDPVIADPSAEPTLDIDAIEPKVGGERKSDAIFTILIFGSDTTSGLTDTMMVATYDVTNQKATVMSLPRDTLINSSARPNINAKKLNAVYNVYGQGDDGIEALRNEVSELVGFVPDYYVQVDWEIVGEMVDAIGGVWFDNPYHMEYYDPFQDLNIYQPQGNRKLNGNDAMQVVRWRHNNPGVPIKPGSTLDSVSDIERLNVQHAFLEAVLKQTLQIQNLFRIGEIIDLFNSRVKSDLKLGEMVWFAQEAVVGGLTVEDVTFCTMPNLYGSYLERGYRDPSTFVYPKQSELLTIINESLNPFVEEVTIKQLDLISQNADGSLRSSTGRLAAPELGQVPVWETDPPEESDLVSTDPIESDPAESSPLESDPNPIVTEPQPPEPPPAGTDTPVDPVNDPGAWGGDTDLTDWGETLE